jgi:NAD(P)-dependent dehydrogenase (short-subunit alcohol dehydrogenase family)
VIVVDIDELAAARVAGELGDDAEHRCVDVTDEDAWRSLAAELSDPPVTLLVNCAGGVRTMGPLHETEPAAWRETLELNLTSVFLGMRFFLPLMLDAGAGSIINISSISGVVGQPDSADYQAAKAGVRLLTRNAAVAYAERGVRVNTLIPGIVNTAAVAGHASARTQRFIDGTPMRRLGTPREIARAAVYLASDEAGFTTGAELCVDGGYTAH